VLIHDEEEPLRADLFKSLVSTPGVSGREERVRELVKREIAGLGDEVHVDRLGNVIARRRGERPRVMIAAHMDSIGFLVRHVDDMGFVRVSPVGGFDPRTLLAQRVLVLGKRDYVGLLSTATKPIHLLTEEDRKKAPKIEDLFVDLMVSPEEVKRNVSIGDAVTLYRTPLVTDDAVTAPYLYDRLGVYVLLEALRAAHDTTVEVHAVVSVQEEVGLRGARTSAYGIDPEIGVALDVTLATDLPGADSSQQVSRLGGGAAISVMDSASISDPRLVARFRELAEKHAIDHQLKILPRGGTDAGAIQLARSGVPVITISVPVRYVHTANEMASVSDIDAAVALVARFLESAHDVDLAW
jgi:putative aminopeptidase FrvX